MRPTCEVLKHFFATYKNITARAHTRTTNKLSTRGPSNFSVRSIFIIRFQSDGQRLKPKSNLNTGENRGNETNDYINIDIQNRDTFIEINIYQLSLIEIEIVITENRYSKSKTKSIKKRKTPVIDIVMKQELKVPK